MTDSHGGGAAARPSRSGMMSLADLHAAAGVGEIDTVILAFTDMQGRLAGKRLSAEYFLDEVAEHYAEGCNYLLAVDVDMNTVGGYDMSSWERGYGDFVLKPDLATLRHLSSPRRARSCRRRSPGSQSAAGWRWPALSWSSSSTRTASSRRPTRATRTWFPPTSTTSTTRYSAPPGSTRCCGASPAAWPGPGCTSNRPRASATSASTRSRSATPTRSPRATTTRSTRL